MSQKALRSFPKHETLLIEINPLHSNVAIPRRLSWDQVTQNPLWKFKDEQPPIRKVLRTKLIEITKMSDGSVQFQIAPSSSSRFYFNSSRPESFKTFKEAAKQPSERFKDVDFSPNIPKIHYSEEDEDSNQNGFESLTLSDMRSQRNQLTVISSTIDHKRAFKKDKDPIVRSFRKNLKRLNSKEEMKSL
ncbi:Uncharacterized protein Adt_03297 [Abeliophyllum distichum]|uniref:Uncharacterized protein n=1 Tax=Abeliophyllum distichum TaxID=126358 RepID=A0ABD1VY48_9LAMI